MTQGKIAHFKLGIAVGVGLSSFYLLCIVLMALGGSSLSTQILNTIFHGLDFSSLMNTNVQTGKRLVGLLGIFFVGYILGSIIAVVYNFLEQCDDQPDLTLQQANGSKDGDIQHDFIFYKSVLSEGPVITVLVIFSLCAFYHTFKYPELTDHLSVPVFGFIPLPLLAITPLVLLGYVVHRLFDRRYVIGSNYVHSIKGLLSFHKKDMHLGYKDIRGVEIDLSLYGRIFDIGTIRIGSAMSENIEIEMPGVKSPSQIRDLILLRCKLLRKSKQNQTNNKLRGVDND